MQSNKNNNFIEIMMIPEINEMTVKKSKSIFNNYKQSGIIIEGIFDDDKWMLSDDYSNVGFDFSLTTSINLFRGKIDGKDFMEYLKAYVLYHLGSLSLDTIQGMIRDIKYIVYFEAKELKAACRLRNITNLIRIEEFIVSA